MKNEVYTTYNAIVLSISSLFVLVFWYVLGVITFPKDWETHKGLLLIGKIVVEYLTSYGFYKLITTILHSLAKRLKFIKSLLLGNSYIEGTWIGYYIGVSGEIRYIIEYYEQDLDGIQIRGESYTKDLKLHSKWSSTSVNVLPDIGQIIYTYTVESTDENTNNLGCASFSFKRNSKNDSPYALLGYSIDVQFGKRVSNYERKISKNGRNCDKSPQYIEIARQEFECNPLHL